MQQCNVYKKETGGIQPPPVFFFVINYIQGNLVVNETREAYYEFRTV